MAAMKWPPWSIASSSSSPAMAAAASTTTFAGSRFGALGIGGGFGAGADDGADAQAAKFVVG